MTLRIGLGILCAILLTPTIVAIPANNVKDRATNPLLPNGWTAVGCYTWAWNSTALSASRYLYVTTYKSDSTSARTISTASTTSLNSMTLASCITFCTTMAPSGPYLYAGVEFGRVRRCSHPEKKFFNTRRNIGMLYVDYLCPVWGFKLNKNSRLW